MYLASVYQRHVLSADQFLWFLPVYSISGRSAAKVLHYISVNGAICSRPEQISVVYQQTLALCLINAKSSRFSTRSIICRLARGPESNARGIDSTGKVCCVTSDPSPKRFPSFASRTRRKNANRYWRAKCTLTRLFQVHRICPVSASNVYWSFTFEGY